MSGAFARDDWRPPQPEGAIAVIGWSVCFPSAAKANGHRPRLTDVHSFDATLFRLAPGEVRMIDPQHRIFLECCWEAFAHAGYVPGRNCTGVYASCAPSVYALEAMEAGELSDDLRRGTDKDYLPAFVSQTLGLVGPSIAIQSACASAIAAIHVACQSLIAGECDMAIAGAVCALGAADTRKDIHALTTVGDGAGAFLLKPLGRAEEDGDYVHATILGSALAHSGSRLQPGIADSSIVRHVQRSALAAADIDRNQVDYVEMHCSGPEAADSIELAALRAAYRSDQRLPEFGSCRKDVAYAGVASGIAGFLHAIEWVGKRPRPPGPDDGNTAKDQIDLRSRPRIAAVNAIGMTGTHGHLIVSQAPSRNAPMAGAAGEFHAILLSARTSSGLARLAGMLAGYCCGIGDDLPIADIACTLMIGREQFAVRAVSLCRDAHELLTDLGAIAAGRFDRERALRAADAPAELVATARRWLSSDTAAWPLPQRRQRRLPLPWPPLERQPFHRIFGAGVV